MEQLIYGIRPITEALLAGKTIDKLFLQKDLKSDQSKELLELARQLGVSIVKAPKEKLNRICRQNHQGVVAFASPVEFHPVEEIVTRVFEMGETPFFLMLDKVNDVRNFGSIVRSAVSAGCHAVIIPHKGSAAISEDAMKTSAGAMNHIPICKVSSLGETILYLKNSGIVSVACTEKSQVSIHDIDLSRPLNLLFGNEGEGIEPHLLRMTSEQAQIPMYGKVSSLNVAVAAGIAMFEAARQRHS